MNWRKGIAALVASVIIGVMGAALFSAWARPRNRVEGQAVRRSSIAFVSTRHDPSTDPAVDLMRTWLASEIYVMNGDGTNPRRLTENTYADGFPALSPNGSRIVFDSNRLRGAGEPFNTSDLFVVNADGTGEMPLTRGSSATWSPDGKRIAFHASASGKGQPIKSDPGAATNDSDLFVLDVDDSLNHRGRPKNITNSPEAIDDDPDWSVKGQKIVFTSHAITDNPTDSRTAEIYEIDADGTGKPVRLTHNAEEERAATWSPDGKRILFMCRRGPAAEGGVLPTFELCVMNADGSDIRRLTNNKVPDLSPRWSPDGLQIVFHRPVGGRGQFQLFVMNADGTGEKQLTFRPGINAFANWGEIRGRGAAK
jgi:TolB protein